MSLLPSNNTVEFIGNGVKRTNGFVFNRRVDEKCSQSSVRKHDEGDTCV